MLENVHTAIIDPFETGPDSCLLQAKYKLKEKQDFSLDLGTGQKIPLKLYETKQDCRFSKVKELKSPEFQFVTWMYRKFEHDRERAFLYLSTVKPEAGPIDKSGVKFRFSSAAVPVEDVSKILVNVTMFDTNQPVKFQMNNGTFDSQGRLHGPAALQAEQSLNQQIPKHPMLDWRIHAISGIFDHGLLQGIVRLQTLNDNTIWANFKDSVMHGPVYAWGLTPILHELVCIVTAMNLDDRFLVI